MLMSINSKKTIRLGYNKSISNTKLTHNEGGGGGHRVWTAIQSIKF
jgi:hypothetical protein